MSISNFKTFRFPTNRSQSTILKHVRDLGPVSRSRLADDCGIPRPAVTRTVLTLLEKEFLINLPLADVSGSRRRDGLSLNPKSGYCLSVFHGPSGIDGTIMNTAYEAVVQKQQRGDWKSMSQQERLDAIFSFVTHLQSFAPISNRPCLGLAVVDSGVIDPQTGTSLQATTLDHWSNVPIVATLEKQLGLPVMLVNGSQACLRVIDRLELQSAIDDLLYIQYAEGIGCSIKSGGHYIAGYSSMAGEFGHCKVTDNDMPCRCGEIGCLEAVAALPALVREVKTSMAQGCASTLGKQTHFDGHDVLKAASEGDRLACRVVHKAFSHLASAVGGLINILAPTVVLFDHCVGMAGEDLVSALLLETQRHALPIHSPHLDVRVSQIETEIISCGGAVALLDTCLEY